jgi:LysR family nitrogen assimilation transcriptional regulator
MDVNQLRTLIQVAELGSLSKAADRLCIAQPALSRRINHLEEELDTRLFERHGRGMVLTTQGSIVLQFARQIMGIFEEIKTSLADEVYHGHISVGLPPTISDLLTVPLVAAISEAYPSVTCRITGAYSLELLEMVHRGEIDVAVLYDPLYIRSLRSVAFLEEALFVIAPEGAGLSREIPVDFKDLASTPLLLPSAKHSLRQIVDNAATECGIKLDVRIELDSYAAIKQLVIAGYGWTILPSTAIDSDPLASRFCISPLINPCPIRNLELCYPADKPVTRLATFVGQKIINLSAGLIKAGLWNGKILANG